MIGPTDTVRQRDGRYAYSALSVPRSDSFSDGSNTTSIAFEDSARCGTMQDRDSHAGSRTVAKADAVQPHQYG